jgi:hypothetical protein
MIEATLGEIAARRKPQSIGVSLFGNSPQLCSTKDKSSCPAGKRMSILYQGMSSRDRFFGCSTSISVAKTMSIVRFYLA